MSEPVPTLILDGIWGGHARWGKLRRKVEREVGPCRIWHYDNSGRCDLEVLGRRLVELLRGTGGWVNLIGYSMGGLVIREALRQEPGLPVRRAVFYHTPHAGSLAARLLPLPACRDMRPGSAFLRRLDAAEWRTPTLVTWCPGDLMVVPGSSAAWPRASRILRSDVPAHAWPVISSRLHEAAVEFLCEG